VSIVFKARQFSLGAEGQLLLGALAAASSRSTCRRPRRPPAAGAGWRRRRRLSVGADPRRAQGVSPVDEIVSTLMLNVIALQVFNLLLFKWLRDPTRGLCRHGSVPESAVMPLVDPRGDARHRRAADRRAGGGGRLVSDGPHALWL
jgi:ABC-type uncharacterized transport system permease subunit